MPSERVTVSMTPEQAERLRRTVAAGAAESLSAYVSEAVRQRLARDEGLAMLEKVMGGPPADEDAITWARRALGIGVRAAS
ncbi:MAG TPA: hypothetical protein VGL93_35805 [Streptosporangiaceae bacterium]|jgi:Arc/MetJ-type ribon-helix-helix transcriptional regulator